jgi:hypothetical protein
VYVFFEERPRWPGFETRPSGGCSLVARCDGRERLWKRFFVFSLFPRVSTIQGSLFLVDFARSERMERCFSASEIDTESCTVPTLPDLLRDGRNSGRIVRSGFGPVQSVRCPLYEDHFS